MAPQHTPSNRYSPQISRGRRRPSRKQRLRRTTLTFALLGVALVLTIVYVATRGGQSGPAAAPPAHLTKPVRSIPSTTATSQPESATTSTAASNDPFGPGAVSYAASRTGTIAAAAYDLDTGQHWDLDDAAAPQAEASIVKVAILEALLAKSDGAGLAADEQPTAQAMIEESDNDSATDLWDDAGGTSGIASFDSSAGLSDTTPSQCVQCPGFPWPGWGLTKTTPEDQITLLRLLTGPNSLLTSSEQSYALGLMENVTSSEQWGVDGGVPSGVTVALKNGWLPLNDADTDWQINSIGWISGDGRDYLLAVLSTGDPSEQYGIDSIDELSSMVYASFG